MEHDDGPARYRSTSQADGLDRLRQLLIRPGQHVVVLPVILVVITTVIPVPIWEVTVGEAKTGGSGGGGGGGGGRSHAGHPVVLDNDPEGGAKNAAERLHTARGPKVPGLIDQETNLVRPLLLPPVRRPDQGTPKGDQIDLWDVFHLFPCVTYRPKHKRKVLHNCPRTILGSLMQLQLMQLTIESLIGRQCKLAEPSGFH